MIDNKSKIIKVRKNADGDITDVMLDNTAVHSLNDAIRMAKQGMIEGVYLGSHENPEYLRTDQNGTKEDNLNNLPTF